MITADQVKSAIDIVDAFLDMALPTLGQAELVPLADAVSALGKKIADAVAGQPPLAAEVAAADAAAVAAETVKFPAP